MTKGIHEQTTRKMGRLDAAEMVRYLNWKLNGWANYFCLGPVSKAYRLIDKYTTTRLRRWLCKKHKLSSGKITRFPDKHLYKQLGLINLTLLPQRLPWAKA